MTPTLRSQYVLAMTCLIMASCGSNNNASSSAVTAPSIDVQTQSSYTQGNQPLSSVLTQVQQNYQNQLQSGQ